MMRRSHIRVLLAGLAVVAFASSLAVLPAVAAATTATAISFSGSRQLVSVTNGPGNIFQPVTEGTWVADGAISGTFAAHDQAQAVQMSPQSTHFGTLHIDEVLTGVGGTITMGIQGQFVSITDTGIETVQGHWTIITATGSYTGLRGSGNWDATIDTNTVTITDTLTGFAFYGSG
jgi:hypothetical protein